MVSDVIVTEIKKEMIANGDGDEDLAEKYRSRPIRVDSLRNSLRASIFSKRGSMTSNELKFVEAMLEEPLDENELQNMDEVLRCDRTFFRHSVSDADTADSEGDNSDIFGSADKDGHIERHISAPCLGSKKRQVYLEARRKLSTEQSRRRAKSLWKKASAAAHVVGLLSKAKKSTCAKAAAGKVEPDDDRAETERIASTTTDEIEERETMRKPVFLKQESGGEGIEIGFDEDLFNSKPEGKEKNRDDEEENEDEEEQIRSSAVTSTPTNRGREGFRRASTNIYDGKGFEVAEADLFEEIYDGNERKANEQYDPWLYQDIDGNGKQREFTILGTSHDDSACYPHVLYPIQMDRLQAFLPDTKKGESFWLKYSLVRDGASTISFLKQVRASPYTLLAVETIDGEVFGGFFSNPWTVQPNYFGTGESFLWRMKHSRKIPGSHEEGGNDNDENTNEESLVEQIERESDLEIFPSEAYYGNNLFQMCHQDKIAAGGGTASFPQDFGSDGGKTYAPHEIGFGLHLGTDGYLLEGSSSASLTFRNPPLALAHPDGSKFEVLNLEAWGFTPCLTEEEARLLEYKNLFFKRHSSGSFGN